MKNRTEKEQCYKLCAIIVTFSPDVDNLNKIIHNINFDVNNIVIVDNYHNTTDDDIFEELKDKYKKLEVVRLKDNLGIAEAQNIGVNLAEKLGNNLYIFFDQDSLPDQKMISNLIKTQNNLLSEGILVGAVGPISIDRRDGTISGFIKRQGLKLKRVIPDGGECCETDFLISSGTLVRAEVLKHTGLFNADFFIDHVDTEWCLRACSLGYKIFGVRDAVLNHALGDKTKKIWLIRWRNVPIHSAFRYYFIFRNTIYMSFYLDFPLFWRVILINRIVIFFVYYAVSMSLSRELFSNMMLGVIDGFRKKMGPHFSKNKKGIR